MVLADLLPQLLGELAELWLQMRIKNESFVSWIGVDAVPVLLEADVLLVEVEAVNGMWLQVSGKMFLTLVSFLKAHEVVVLLKLVVFLQGDRCDVDVFGRRNIDAPGFEPIFQ